MNLPVDPRNIRGALTVRSNRLMRGQYADFLPAAQAVAEREAAPMARTLILVIGVVFVAFFAWAGIAEVEQVAAAPGVVRPAGKVKIVNHPDGGRVANLLVAEGNFVKKNQVLIELDAGFVREEMIKRTSEWQGLSAEASRLEAEAVGKQPVFDLKLSAARPDLILTHRQLYEARRQSLAARRETADRVAEQRDRDFQSQQARLAQLRRSYNIMKQQEDALKQLANKGYFPKLQFLSIKRQVSELAGQIAQARQSVGAAKSARSEALSQRGSIDKEWRSDVLARLNVARTERDRAKSSLTQEQSRLRNLLVRAPIGGVVKDIAVSGPGQSIRASEPLLKIVPSGRQLIVETKVSNADIGYITKGQEATVKIRTYDFVRYGALKGVVEQIAADASEDTETGQLWFNVTVRTKKDYLGARVGEKPVNPGMQADVDLVIGKRSILSYLTDRLDRSVKSSFRER